jgi:hypothetical protein
VEIILRADSEFGFTKTESEACFTEAGDDEDKPIHGRKTTKKSATQGFRPSCGLSSLQL